MSFETSNINDQSDSIKKVLSVRHLSDELFIVRFERGNLQFETGQYLFVGIKPNGEHREYSIYSGEFDAYLEILVKKVDRGTLSPLLKKLKKGDHVSIEGPYGSFVIKEDFKEKPLTFLATGTGISPFHSFVKTHPYLNYQVIHGVSREIESMGKDFFEPKRYQLWVSREDSQNNKGRITTSVKKLEGDVEGNYFLCGHSEMIVEAYDILKEKGISSANIHTEVYY